jgi:hypothetical protein
MAFCDFNELNNENCERREEEEGDAFNLHRFRGFAAMHFSYIFCENYSEMRKRENEEEYFDRVRWDAGSAGIVDGVKDRGDLMVGFLKV